MRRLLVGLFVIVIAHPAVAAGHWYYCDPAHAYYPYVRACPVPWREVTPYSYGQGQPQASAPPVAQPAAPAWVVQVPSAASPPESRPSAAYQQGQADRQSWEAWFSSQSGDYRAGAEYWAGQRSLPHPGSCAAVPPSTGADWTAGCFAAQAKLAPSDVRRKTEPEYRLGWNNSPAVAAAPTTTSAAAPDLGTAQATTARDEGQSTLPASSTGKPTSPSGKAFDPTCVGIECTTETLAGTNCLKGVCADFFIVKEVKEPNGIIEIDEKYRTYLPTNPGVSLEAPGYTTAWISCSRPGGYIEDDMHTRFPEPDPNPAFINSPPRKIWLAVCGRGSATK